MGLEFFSYNATKDQLCRSTIHFTLPYIFNRNTHSCQSRVARDRWRLSKLAKVSDVDQRSNTIHVRSVFSFARCALTRVRSNEVKRRLPWSNGEGNKGSETRVSSPCFGSWWRCGQNITHRALFCHLRRCSDVLSRSQNNSQLLFLKLEKKTGKVFPFLCLCSVRTVSWYALGLQFAVVSVANCKTHRAGCFISTSCPAWSEKKIGNILPVSRPSTASKHSAVRHVQSQRNRHVNLNWEFRSAPAR